MNLSYVKMGFIGSVLCGVIEPVSLVNNMKIRRIFDAGALLEKERKSRVVVTALPIFYQRHRFFDDHDLGVRVREKSISGGALLNVRYLPSKFWWLEGTTGIESEHTKAHGTFTSDASRFGFDDIVFSAGHNSFIGKKAQFVVYGLASFPTRWKVCADEVFNTLVGTRFFSAGLGLEFSYRFLKTCNASWVAIVQGRFDHFFKRHWSPILPPDAYIQPGNMSDLLFAIQYLRKRTVFELGYNSTWFTNQAVIRSGVETKADTLVRQSVYGSLTHLCKRITLGRKPIAVGLGLSVGKSRRFDTNSCAIWADISLIL